MTQNKRQLLVLLILNVFLVFIFVLGVQETIQIVNWISGITVLSYRELEDALSTNIIRFFSLDIKYLAGIFLCLFIIVFDSYVFLKWFNSFKFISAKRKTCVKCERKLIREQRLPSDHIVSVFIPMKRYRCVGCGQQYLKVEKDHRHPIHEHELVTVNPADLIKVEAKSE